MWQLVVDPEVLLQMGTALGEVVAGGAEQILLKTKIFVVFFMQIEIIISYPKKYWLNGEGFN